ncbi:hypothetical protein [Nitratifractor sp.]
MTWGEVRDFVSLSLKGDNSNADPKPIHLKMAIMEIETLCEPREYRAQYTGAETDVFRLLPPLDVDEEANEYLKMPDIPAALGDDDPVPIDPGLEPAVIYMVASFFSHKSRDYYEAKAKRIIDIFVSNERPESQFR